MFKQVHKYIVKAFIGPWIITFLICVFLLLMQFLWKYIDDLVGKGLEWNIIVELLFYASLTLVPLALPLSILLATIMTFGGLGEKNELFAMKSGGISLYRIMYPLLIFNIIISFGAFYFANNLLPYTNLKMRSLLFSIQQQRPEVNIRNGIFTEPVDNLSIKVDRKYRNNNTLEGVLIYDHRNLAGNNNVTTAKAGNIKITEDKTVLIMELFDGFRYEDLKLDKNKKKSNKTRPHQTSKYKKQIVYIELDGLGLDRSNEDLFKNGFEMLNNQQLTLAADSLSRSLHKREQEIWFNLKKYSLFKGEASWLNQSEEQKQIAQIEVQELFIEDPKFAINSDSVFANLNLNQKNKVIDFALNYSRAAKQYVEVTDIEVQGYKRWIARHDIEWHRKYMLSIACLLFFLVGAPLGAIIRKGGFGLPVIISVFIFLIYYVISITFEKTVRELVLAPEIGMWISSYMLIPVGFFLIYRTANDSMRVSPHFYRKLKSIFQRNKSRNT
ncbi:MAG: LptF/LptG family permease [Bacteroidales bacterium]|nr:LptF/LptG family permease [Bacteroidales bacterium]